MELASNLWHSLTHSVLGWTPGCASPVVSLLRQGRLPLSGWPRPLGLVLGLSAVAVGQLATLLFFYYRREIRRGRNRLVQQLPADAPPPYDFWEGVRTHLAQPEGFLLLGSYLSLTWMFNLMPASYYSMEGSVNWLHVFAQLVIQDLIQTLMHMGEHSISAEFYKRSHKPHHRWLNPRLFDAFNGSTGDTICMILIPLYITANIVHCNVWSYMAFGTIYANYLTLIHSEFAYPWDPYLRKLGVGTPADHHVHHKLFKYNYGHIFMWWDRLFGTYRNPNTVSVFNSGV